MLNVPFAIADATTLTEARYVGEDVGEHPAKPTVGRVRDGACAVGGVRRVRGQGRWVGTGVSRVAGGRGLHGTAGL